MECVNGREYYVCMVMGIPSSHKRCRLVSYAVPRYISRFSLSLHIKTSCTYLSVCVFVLAGFIQCLGDGLAWSFVGGFVQQMWESFFPENGLDGGGSGAIAYRVYS